MRPRARQASSYPPSSHHQSCRLNVTAQSPAACLSPNPVNSSAERLQALDGIDSALLQRDPINAQDLRSARVIVLVDTALGVAAALHRLRGQLRRQAGEVLADGGDDVAVAVVASGDEEALAARLGALHGVGVGERDVAHVDPDEDARGGDLGAPLALQQVDEALVARVDGGERGDVVPDGAEDHGRADGGEVEAGLLGGDEVPGGLLGVLLRGAVRARLVAREALLVRQRVPVGLAEGLGRVRQLRHAEDGGEGARDDDAAHRGRVLLHGAQDRERALDGWVEQLRLGVRPAVVEWRCRVLDVLEALAVVLDDLVERVGLGDVRDNGHR